MVLFSQSSSSSTLLCQPLESLNLERLKTMVINSEDLNCLTLEFASCVTLGQLLNF